MLPDLSEPRGRLDKATHDRRCAELALNAAPPITDVAAFHCQQAVEKMLKAYLTARGHAFEKIHDLHMLTLACADYDTEFRVLLPRVAPLTVFAVRFRYPGPAEPSPEQIREALTVVSDVWNFVLDRLPSHEQT